MKIVTSFDTSIKLSILMQNIKNHEIYNKIATIGKTDPGEIFFEEIFSNMYISPKIFSHNQGFAFVRIHNNS